MFKNKSEIMLISSREYLVDLLRMPGVLNQPDSSLNSALSSLVSSPLCHPKFKSVKTAQDIQTLAKLYFFDWQSLALAFDNASLGGSLFLSCICPYSISMISLYRISLSAIS